MLRQISTTELRTIINFLRASIMTAGDVVEFGAYCGDTSIELAKIIDHTDKTLYLYDSFEGLPTPTQEDVGTDFRSGDLKAQKSALNYRFSKSDFKMPIITKAWFSDLTKDDLPSEIAFALVDGVFYESTAQPLNLICPKMNKKGAIIIHGYARASLPGVKKAVDEWLVKHPNYHLRQVNTLAIIQQKV